MTETRLKIFADKNPQSRPSIESMITKMRSANWTNLEELRGIYPHADEAMVKSGRKVTILNVGGNNWRAVVAFHYNRQIVFILKIMTHAEYSKGKWKQVL
jgi:mRNA interferase HigB